MNHENLNQILKFGPQDENFPPMKLVMGLFNKTLVVVGENRKKNHGYKVSTKTCDKLRKQIMMNIIAYLTARKLLLLFTLVHGRDRTDDFEKVLSMWESIIEKGQGNICVRVMVRGTKIQLHRYFSRSPTPSPKKSLDEDGDELDEHQCSAEAVFCENILVLSAIQQEDIPLTTLFRLGLIYEGKIRILLP